jgi:hypothetical protein
MISASAWPSTARSRAGRPRASSSRACHQARGLPRRGAAPRARSQGPARLQTRASTARASTSAGRSPASWPSRWGPPTTTRPSPSTARRGAPPCLGKPGDFYAVLRAEGLVRALRGAATPDHRLRSPPGRARTRLRGARRRAPRSLRAPPPREDEQRDLPLGRWQDVRRGRGQAPRGSREVRAARGPAPRPAACAPSPCAAWEAPVGPSLYALSISQLRGKPHDSECEVYAEQRCSYLHSLLLRPAPGGGAGADRHRGVGSRRGLRRSGRGALLRRPHPRGDDGGAAAGGRGAGGGEIRADLPPAPRGLGLRVPLELPVLRPLRVLRSRIVSPPPL